MCMSKKETKLYLLNQRFFYVLINHTPHCSFLATQLIFLLKHIFVQKSTFLKGRVKMTLPVCKYPNTTLFPSVRLLIYDCVSDYSRYTAAYIMIYS